MNRLYTILNAGEQSTRRRGRLNIDQPQRPSNPDTFSPSGAPVVWDSSQIEPVRFLVYHQSLDLGFQRLLR